ncbi:MAG: glycoside hydrolase family 127 protein [Phycisphaeraceae bacterium]|nr:glycoside hydrolase family 127 protein [Phycisphaeraceae bacterium]
MTTAAPTRGEIRIYNETITPFPSYAVSRGIPLPPGAVKDPSEISIRDKDGKSIPFGAKVLQRRPDGSIEWLLVDYSIDLAAEEEKSLFIELRPGDAPAVKNPVQVSESADSVTLTNGITTLVISRKGGSIVREWSSQGRQIVGPQDLFDLETMDTGTKIYRASLSGPLSVSVEHANPLRAVVLVEGKHTARDKSTFLDFQLRFVLTANLPDVRFEHTFLCREKAELVHARAIRLVTTTRMDPAARKLIRQKHHTQEYFHRPMSLEENVEVVSSSVSDLDHYERDFKPFKMGTVFIRNFNSLKEDSSKYPYHMRPDSPSKFREDYGVGAFRQIFEYLGWTSNDLSLSFSFLRWDKLHPKSIALDENRMTISIWPEWATPCRMTQGASKTHVFHITSDPRSININEVERRFNRWEMMGLDPVAISFDPAWPAHCEVLDQQHLFKYQPKKYPFLENLIEVSPAAGNPGRWTYYRLPGAGMWHFGDLGGEGGFNNNEDDGLVLFPLVDYLRTGNVYCYDYGVETAKHYMEVDFCEFSTNARQNGGLIAHTVNHFEGMAYPSHEWVEGILAYYYLTGDPRAKRTVIRVGDHYIWWANNLMSTIAVDGREAGMPLVNLAAVYRLTGDKKYLDAAFKIVDAFHRKHYEEHGELKYPYPQYGNLEGGSWQKNIRGYGDWSSYSGLYRLWEQSHDEKLKELLINLLKVAVQPESFSVNDARAMDFFTVWIYMKLTGDTDVINRLGMIIPMLLKRGGHPTRRLHFLKELDERGLIDERIVGSRGGVI